MSTTIEKARTALDLAEQNHAAALEREATAKAALDQAATLAGDDPSPQTAATWKAAKEGYELAALATSGTLRRLDAARAAFTDAEIDDARAKLAKSLDMADRGQFFDRLSPTIASLARADSVVACDVYALDDGEVSTLGPAFVEKIRAMRALRLAVLEQHNACTDATAAAHLAKVQATNVREVPEKDVLALAAIEALALEPAVDADDRMRRILNLVGSVIGVAGTIEYPVKKECRTPAIYVEWARLALRSGDADAATRAVTLAHRTPAEIARDDQNARAREATTKAYEMPSPAELVRRGEERRAGPFTDPVPAANTEESWAERNRRLTGATRGAA